MVGPSDRSARCRTRSEAGSTRASRRNAATACDRHVPSGPGRARVAMHRNDYPRSCVTAGCDPGTSAMPHRPAPKLRPCTAAARSRGRERCRIGSRRTALHAGRAWPASGRTLRTCRNACCAARAAPAIAGHPAGKRGAAGTHRRSPAPLLPHPRSAGSSTSNTVPTAARPLEPARAWTGIPTACARRGERNFQIRLTVSAVLIELLTGIFRIPSIPVV